MQSWIPQWWKDYLAGKGQGRADLFQSVDNIVAAEDVKGLDLEELRKLVDTPAWAFVRKAAAGRLQVMLNVLTNSGSTDGQIRYAQGAIDSLQWILGAPEVAFKWIADEKMRQVVAEKDTNND